MKVLRTTTEDLNRVERTILDADASAGNNVVLTVLNNDKLANTDYIVIGAEGSESAELVQINAAVTAGTSVQVATLTRAHKKGEPIVKYRYNKRKFYGSATETGSYIELTAYGSPAIIQVDDPQAAVLEYTDTTYSYFKATYYNSTTLEESAIADAAVFRGDDTGRYCSIYAIRVQTGLTQNPFITDGQIDVYRKRAENEVNSFLINRYTLPLTNASGVFEVPWMIENVTTLLAAGYMDYQEFGAEGMGVKWLGEARGILKKIQEGTMALIGIDGQEMTAPSTLSTVQSYPDRVDNENEDGPSQTFTINQRF